MSLREPPSPTSSSLTENCSSLCASASGFRGSRGCFSTGCSRRPDRSAQWDDSWYNLKDGYLCNSACTHSSCSSSIAELRFSGSHCSIFRTRRRNISFSFPWRLVSLCSRGICSPTNSPAQRSPRIAKTVNNQHALLKE